MLQGRSLVGMALVGAAFLGLSGGVAAAQNGSHCKVDRTPPGEAEVALGADDFHKAEELYQAALQKDPNSVTATVGLIRAELGESKLLEARQAAKAASERRPHDPAVMTVAGEVAMRRGEPALAAQAFNDSGQVDACQARTRYDISRYLSLIGMAATAKKELDLAHALAPLDPTITAAWTEATAKRPSAEQRIAALTERMNAAGATAEQKAEAADTIKRIQAEQRGSCQPVKVIETAALKMVDMADGPTIPYGVGLDVQLNGKRKRLQIDTGASGLLLNRSAALSAGLRPEAAAETGGIGDEGQRSGYVTHVDSLRLGDMEFHNCMVRVVEHRGALDVDGLIGMDVFENYLVTLDTPGRVIRLAPPPTRPNTTAKPNGLATTGDVATDGQASEAPVDRYIAPEMKDWTQVYRGGHMLIFPTTIGDAPAKLFVMDTGASTSLISPEAAREVTHVGSNDLVSVKGINGTVKKVSEADQVTITFGRVRQQIRQMTAIDTTGISSGLGVELAGFIGFPTLSELVITIDYRDDLVHVVYDPNHGVHLR